MTRPHEHRHVPPIPRRFLRRGRVALRAGDRRRAAGAREPAGHGHGRRDAGSAGRHLRPDSNGTCPAAPIPTWPCTTWNGSCGRRETRLAVGTLFERDPQALPTLLQIFAASQYLERSAGDRPGGLRPAAAHRGAAGGRQALVDELVAEIAALEHETAVLRALRRFKRRETLRIAYGDIVREQSLRTVTTQISFVADAILEAAVAGGAAEVSAPSAARRSGPTASPPASSCWAWASSAAWN